MINLIPWPDLNKNTFLIKYSWHVILKSPEEFGLNDTTYNRMFRNEMELIWNDKEYALIPQTQLVPIII